MPVVKLDSAQLNLKTAHIVGSFDDVPQAGRHEPMVFFTKDQAAIERFGSHLSNIVVKSIKEILPQDSSPIQIESTSLKSPLAAKVLRLATEQSDRQLENAATVTLGSISTSNLPLGAPKAPELNWVFSEKEHNGISQTNGSDGKWKPSEPFMFGPDTGDFSVFTDPPVDFISDDPCDEVGNWIRSNLPTFRAVVAKVGQIRILQALGLVLIGQGIWNGVAKSLGEQLGKKALVLMEELIVWLNKLFS